MVKDRNVPIAKIVPLSSADDLDADTLAFVATGKVRLGKGRLPRSFWALPAPRIPLKRIVEAVRAEREED